MALEFDCPYCKAMIRVPDNAAGKKGRCPQCAAKINVPKLGQARRAGTEQPFFPGPPDPGAIAAAPPADDEDVIFGEYDPQQDAIDPAVQAALLPGDIAIPALGPDAPRSFPSPVRQLPDTLLSKKSQRRGGGWVWAVIAFVLLAGGGAAGGLYWFSNTEKLEGRFEAQVVENPPMPPTVIPRTLIDVPAADAGKVLSQLERNPAMLVSNVGLATVQFQGGEQGLLVSVVPGNATTLFRVEIDADKHLRKYLREHQKDYERIRNEDLALAVNQLFRTIKKGLNSKQVSSRDLQEYRDSVGFTAPVRGFGYFVSAAHRKQIYPCVHEDDEALYFLLPPGTKHFEIQGKARKKGEPYFPGKFEVKVTGSTKLKHKDVTAEPVDKSEKEPEMMSEEDDEKMSEEKMQEK